MSLRKSSGVLVIDTILKLVVRRLDVIPDVKLDHLVNYDGKQGRQDGPKKLDDTSRKLGSLGIHLCVKKGTADDKTFHDVTRNQKCGQEYLIA